MNDTESTEKAYSELIDSMHAALETYSNVHRGSGHNSMVSTHLFEQARHIVLDFLNLKKNNYVVIFSTLRGSEFLKSKLRSENYQIVSSEETGLPLGVRAIAVRKSALSGVMPSHTGGGTSVLMSPWWVIWAGAPDRFEAGTPPVINIIAFAKALLLVKKYGKDIFKNYVTEKLTAKEILYNDKLENLSGTELLREIKLMQIGKGNQVPTNEGSKPYINFDYSASTPTFEPVWEAVKQILFQPVEVKKEIIHEVKSTCRRFFGAPDDKYEVFFSSNTTEAINLAAENLVADPVKDFEPVVLSTLLEHSSNDLPWRMAASYVLRLSVDNDGFLSMDEMEQVLKEYNQQNLHGKKRIKIVAISGASNVLGVYNDLAETGRIAHKYGAFFLVDAAQLVAHRNISLEQTDIDFFAFSAHKIYAPFGSGVLIARKGLLNFNNEELIKINLSGDENIAGIAALGKALVLLERIGFDLIREEEKALTRHALSGLNQVKGLTIHGISDPESASFSNKGGVIVFSLKGRLASSLSELLAHQRGIGVRAGCHCAHILVKHILHVPPALERFQRVIFRVFKNLRPPGILRISFGIGNSKDEIDTLICVLSEIAENHKTDDSDIRVQIKKFIADTEHKVYSSLNQNIV